MFFKPAGRVCPNIALHKNCITNTLGPTGGAQHRSTQAAENRKRKGSISVAVGCPAYRELRPVEIRAARRGLFDFLIPVLVTGIQPDQVLGLKEPFARRRRGAALIPVTSKG